MKMHAPDGDNIIFLSRWAQELVMGLVVVLVAVVRFIGVRLGGDKKLYATAQQLQSCANSMESALSRLEKKMDKFDEKMERYMEHVHNRIDNLRIDK